MRVADLPRSWQSSNPCAPSPSAPCFSEPRHRSGPGAGTGIYPASPPTAGPASIPATTRAREAWRSRAGRMCPFLRPFRPDPDHRPAPTPVWPSLGHIPLLFSFFLSRAPLGSVFACSVSLLPFLPPGSGAVSQQNGLLGPISQPHPITPSGLTAQGTCPPPPAAFPASEGAEGKPQDHSEAGTPGLEEQFGPGGAPPHVPPVQELWGEGTSPLGSQGGKTELPPPLNCSSCCALQLRKQHPTCRLLQPKP